MAYTQSATTAIKTAVNPMAMPHHRAAASAAPAEAGERTESSPEQPASAPNMAKQPIAVSILAADPNIRTPVHRLQEYAPWPKSRSEERRVGKECRARWCAEPYNK